MPQKSKGKKTTNKKIASVKKPIELVTESPISRILRNANEALNHIEICKLSDIIKGKKDSKEYIILSRNCNQLSKIQKDNMFSLFEKNMKEMYDVSSWGYNKKNLLGDQFATFSKFLLVLDKNNRGVSDSNILAFVNFRFENEDIDNNSSNPILYLYELQLSIDIQYQGIGTKLMEYIDIIQKKWNMWKINLTVFAHNEAAIKFYKKIGYTIDKNYEKEDDADSFIFSNPHNDIYLGDVKIVADELDTIESNEEIKLDEFL